MLNDEYTPELEQEENEIQEVEETEVEETEEETIEQSDNTDWKAEALKWKAIASRKAKQNAKPLEQKKVDKPDNTGISRDEVILYAKGLSDEEVEMAKKVATVSGIKPTEALNDPIYKSWKTQKEEREKKEKATLSASKGSGSASTKKTLNSPGLTEKEHKELWRQKVGR